MVPPHRNVPRILAVRRAIRYLCDTDDGKALPVTTTKPADALRIATESAEPDAAAARATIATADLAPSLHAAAAAAALTAAVATAANAPSLPAAAAAAALAAAARPSTLAALALASAFAGCRRG
mmetsp:Transcript_11376/g.33896  ORF Transcript_11376/g.33896 Transcript_11376/m.33896 type:complete len:124 (-) Transcript_11376:388-759(-)